MAQLYYRSNIRTVLIINLSYADNMVLLRPSVSTFVQLLAISEGGLEYNSKKSDVMVFKARKIKLYNIFHSFYSFSVLR